MAIELFKKGKYWEKAIELTQDLRQQFEENKNYYAYLTLLVLLFIFHFLKISF